MTPKRKRCRSCRRLFAPYNSLVVACSTQCALDLAKSTETMTTLRRRAEAAERRDVETLGVLAGRAQKAFNTFIRLRDRHLPCVACGHPANGPRKRHAGHFIPSGNCAALRFDEANVHACCSRCNLFKSGNLTPYEVELRRRIGDAEVERLKGPQVAPRRRADELRAIATEYRAKYRALLRAIENNREAA